jgi:hypothetical protein
MTITPMSQCHSILLGKNGRSPAQIASVSADLPHGQVFPEHSHPEDQLLFASGPNCVDKVTG